MTTRSSDQHSPKKRPPSTQPSPTRNQLNQLRCPQTVKQLANSIRKIATNHWRIMEVCGGQTNSIVRYGLDQLLAPKISFIHGPGCPVCVTPAHIIEEAITLAQQPNTIVCTFGDMLRVPTDHVTEPNTLLAAKARGAHVQAIYAPEEAVLLAQAQPDKNIVLLAVGFETTIPATAIAAISAKTKKLTNFFMLVSHVSVPPALDALIDAPDHNIDAFLAAGHVCTIMGTQAYEPIVQRGNIPIVVTGFEPVDILRGVLAAVQQLEAGSAACENQYSRYVSRAGNTHAQTLLNTVYTPADQTWRGLGTMPMSGWQLNPEFQAFDAKQLHPQSQSQSQSQSHKNIQIASLETPSPGQNPAACQAGAVLRGKLKPCDCPHFGTLCQPQHPLGAPMVSDEGACAAYFHHRGAETVGVNATGS